MCKLIHDVLKTEIDLTPKPGKVSFSAEDDLWGMYYRARTGLPLQSFETRWDSLEKVPQSFVGLAGPRAASIRIADNCVVPVEQAHIMIKRRASKYLRSYPGPDEAAPSTWTHLTCNRLLAGHTIGNEDLEALGSVLDYRSMITKRATLYKDYLDVNAPDADEVDAYKLMHGHENDSKWLVRRDAI